jgi:hypothetical protein
MIRDKYISCRDEIFNLLAASGVLSDSNRNWLVEVMFDVTGTLVFMTFDEMHEWDRNILLAAESYITYVDEPFKLYNINKKGIVYYKFLDKIIDEKKNLIIIAHPEPSEIIEEYGDLEAINDDEDEITFTPD